MYVPWKGYFDIMQRVDEFVLYDEVQFIKRFWFNRNQIKTPHGLKWLTIPVEVKGKRLQAMKDVRISDPKWAENHWKTIQFAYGKTPYYPEYKDAIEALYRQSTMVFLSEVNCHFLRGLCKILGIDTAISWSMDYPSQSQDPTTRLSEICQATNATHYLSGPSAQNYIKKEVFELAGIELQYMDYAGYPEYPQPHPPFSHAVSVIDLLFCRGSASAEAIWGWRL